MLAASFIAIFLIPVTFYVVERLAAGGHGKPEEGPPTTTRTPGGHPAGSHE